MKGSTDSDERIKAGLLDAALDPRQVGRIDSGLTRNRPRRPALGFPRAAESCCG